MNLTSNMLSPRIGKNGSNSGSTKKPTLPVSEIGIEQNSNYQLTMPVYLNTSFNNIRRKSIQKTQVTQADPVDPYQSNLK